MRYAAERRNLGDSIAELREIAGGRDDILAEAAGIEAGWWYASPATHAGYELVAAGMLIMAGGHDGKPWTLMRWSLGRASATSGAPDHVTGSDDRPLPFIRVVSQAGTARRPAGTLGAIAPCAGVRTATPSELGDEPERRSDYPSRYGQQLLDASVCSDRDASAGSDGRYRA